MTDNSLDKIATEALKPVSEFISALIGPKVKRIKKWAEKQDLKDMKGSIQVAELMNDYIYRLLQRVSGITTIVFPQQRLPLPSIYEPLKISYKYKTSYPENAFYFTVDKIKPGEHILIVDSAGMGKSTFAKHLVLEIFHLTGKTPIFLELRRINDENTLLGTLAKEIDSSMSCVDEKLLFLMLEEGNYVIILDGFDELQIKQREKIGKQITDLAYKCDKNTIVLTTRPEVNLPEIPNSDVFTINHLTIEQAKELVLRYDNVAHIDIGKQLIEEFDKVPTAFLENPLLVVLLYRTYGFNHSIATKITLFYDDIYNALYKGHDLTKAGFNREKLSRLDYSDFRQLLRAFSFLMVVSQTYNIQSEIQAISLIEQAAKLTSIIPSTPSSFLEDLLTTVPLLLKDGTDYRFIHKSILEFFAAEFLAYTHESESIIKRILKGNSSRSFLAVFEFLSEINEKLFRKTIVGPLAMEALSICNEHDVPLVNTIRFFSPIVLKYSNHPSDRPYRFHNMNLSMDFTHEDNMLLVYERIRWIPYNAWILISSPIISAGRLYPINLSEIAKFIPEDGIRIDDIKVLGNIHHSSLQSILRMILHGILPSKEFRLLDIELCRLCIRQIEQETETQKWLEHLIQNNNNS